MHGLASSAGGILRYPFYESKNTVTTPEGSSKYLSNELLVNSISIEAEGEVVEGEGVLGSTAAYGILEAGSDIL